MKSGTSKYGVPRLLRDGRANPKYSRAWRLAHWEYPKAYYIANRGRILTQTREWHRNHPEASRRIAWRAQGISRLDLAEEMWQRARVCGLCGAAFAGDQQNGLSKVLDHDPKSGEPRGVIHRRCNAGLGIFSTPELLDLASQYLRGGA